MDRCPFHTLFTSQSRRPAAATCSGPGLPARPWCQRRCADGWLAFRSSTVTQRSLLSLARSGAVVAPAGGWGRAASPSGAWCLRPAVVSAAGRVLRRSGACVVSPPFVSRSCGWVAVAWGWSAGSAVSFLALPAAVVWCRAGACGGLVGCGRLVCSGPVGLLPVAVVVGAPVWRGRRAAGRGAASRRWSAARVVLAARWCGVAPLPGRCPGSGRRLVLASRAARRRAGWPAPRFPAFPRPLLLLPVGAGSPAAAGSAAPPRASRPGRLRVGPVGPAVRLAARRSWPCRLPRVPAPALPPARRPAPAAAPVRPSVGGLPRFAVSLRLPAAAPSLAVPRVAGVAGVRPRGAGRSPLPSPCVRCRVRRRCCRASAPRRSGARARAVPRRGGSGVGVPSRLAVSVGASRSRRRAGAGARLSVSPRARRLRRVLAPAAGPARGGALPALACRWLPALAAAPARRSPLCVSCSPGGSLLSLWRPGVRCSVFSLAVRGALSLLSWGFPRPASPFAWGALVRGCSLCRLSVVSSFPGACSCWVRSCCRCVGLVVGSRLCAVAAAVRVSPAASASGLPLGARCRLAARRSRRRVLSGPRPRPAPLLAPARPPARPPSAPPAGAPGRPRFLPPAAPPRPASSARASPAAAGSLACPSCPGARAPPRSPAPVPAPPAWPPLAPASPPPPGVLRGPRSARPPPPALSPPPLSSRGWAMAVSTLWTCREGGSSPLPQPGCGSGSLPSR